MVSRLPSVPVLFEDEKFKSEQERDEGCERLREGVREGEKERKKDPQCGCTHDHEGAWGCHKGGREPQGG